MRKIFFAVTAILALGAYAGTRAKESMGTTIPSASTDGVSLSEVTGCRISVLLDAGTLGTGGTLVMNYYDPVLGWVESASSINCTVTATTIDGGTRRAYVCPDIEPLALYGRVAAYAYGVTAVDGGAGDLRVRTECFGPNLP